jgi:hypothetical protein
MSDVNISHSDNNLGVVAAVVPAHEGYKPVPPVATRFQAGQSGNPAGRKSAGAQIRDWLTTLADADADELRKITKGKGPVAKQIAAVRLLRARESADLADFEALTQGKATLSELKAAGVDTSVIKKAKATETGLEVELHDRSLAEAAFVVEQTDGRATQQIQMQGGAQMAIQVILPTQTAHAGDLAAFDPAALPPGDDETL